MPKDRKQVRLRHPVYKTAFHITQELYDGEGAKEPVLSRTLRGHFRLDLLRTLCVGGALLSAVLIAGILADRR